MMTKAENRMTAPDERREKIETAYHLLEEAEAVVIGAGAGLSTAAGLTYGGERFDKYFGDFKERYGMTDMYSAGFYHFASLEEKWAYWSRHIYYNRYDVLALGAYQDLCELVGDQDYFVLTTNVDHQFWLAGFQDERIFATQGDYGEFQCSAACHDVLYDNETAVREMIRLQKDFKVPGGLVPRCPVCGRAMEVHLRCDDMFLEDEAWHKASDRFESFLRAHMDKKIVFLELGVGMNTPGIIKYPFWSLTERWKNSFYICVNRGEAWAPKEIGDRSLCLDEDLAAVLKQLREVKRYESRGEA